MKKVLLILFYWCLLFIFYFISQLSGNYFLEFIIIQPIGYIILIFLCYILAQDKYKIIEINAKINLTFTVLTMLKDLFKIYFGYLNYIYRYELAGNLLSSIAIAICLLALKKKASNKLKNTDEVLENQLQLKEVENLTVNNSNTSKKDFYVLKIILAEVTLLSTFLYFVLLEIIYALYTSTNLQNLEIIYYVIFFLLEPMGIFAGFTFSKNILKNRSFKFTIINGILFLLYIFYASIFYITKYGFTISVFNWIFTILLILLIMLKDLKLEFQKRN